MTPTLNPICGLCVINISRQGSGEEITKSEAHSLYLVTRNRKMKKPISLFVVVITIFLLSGCTYQLKLTRFDIPPSVVEPLMGDTPINIIGPEIDYPIKQVSYSVEGKTGDGFSYFVDFNEVNKIAIDLIKSELKKNNVPISDDAQTVVKFTTTKIEWEYWAGGFVIGTYLNFEVETADGYKNKYTVQDGSQVHLERAVGGAITRAAEKVLQDERILSYIEKTKMPKDDKDSTFKLERLKLLRERGLITEEEYTEKKKEILKDF
jgi:hypothetical protein